MKKYWVYVHTCNANGKKYVGCTRRVKPELRWAEGNGYQYNKHFYSAILKYGWDNIEHEVFEVDSAEEMYRKEVELISFYHSNDPEYGYNNSVGGEQGFLGCKHSEETRKKIAEAAKESHSDPEVRRKRSEAIKKSHSDPEFRKKMSEIKKGKPHKPCSEEARKKMSEAAKKRAKDPEYRKKLSEAQKGKPHNFSEKARKHMAEAAKNRPRIKISLPDGTILEMTKQNLTRNYINKGKKFEYVS